MASEILDLPLPFGPTIAVISLSNCKTVLSGKDAVSRAEKRYELVLENFKAGKYPAHNRQSDEAFHAIASYLAAVGRQQEKMKLRIEELSERFL